VENVDHRAVCHSRAWLKRELNKDSREIKTGKIENELEVFPCLSKFNI
jgi:hypothetical protein